VAVTIGDLWVLLVLGVVIVPASTMLLSLGTRYIPASQVTLIMMLEMLLGPLWVWLALSEVPAPTTVLGGILVLVTVVAHSYVSGAAKAAAAAD
jgi:drug/metabolite transporter (DMT)-like permease